MSDRIDRRCPSCGSTNVESQPYSYNPSEIHCLECDDIQPEEAGDE